MALLTDALAPPDYILGSVMAYSDGDMYNRYMSHIFASKDAFKRVDWWREIHPP